MVLDTPLSLLIHEIKDLYSAEQQLTKALPKVVKAVTSENLAKMLETHLAETHEQLDRIESALTLLGQKPSREKCAGMAGILVEGEKASAMKGDDLLCDLAIISACQRVEHYEIAGYGSALDLANAFGYDEVAGLLQSTLDEEYEASDLLDELASAIRAEHTATSGAEEADEDTDEDDDEDEDADESSAPKGSAVGPAAKASKVGRTAPTLVRKARG
jgi:ferritin-like metal-binding protein YciE